MGPLVNLGKSCPTRITKQPKLGNHLFQVQNKLIISYRVSDIFMNLGV